jgi:hypothetical protein
MLGIIYSNKKATWVRYNRLVDPIPALPGLANIKVKRLIQSEKAKLTCAFTTKRFYQSHAVLQTIRVTDTDSALNP